MTSAQRINRPGMPLVLFSCLLVSSHAPPLFEIQHSIVKLTSPPKVHHLELSVLIANYSQMLRRIERFCEGGPAWKLCLNCPHSRRNISRRAIPASVASRLTEST
jgi:hypothetical protein